MSRKEIFLLHLVSMVNEMFVSIEFNVSWKAESSFVLILVVVTIVAVVVEPTYRHQLHFSNSVVRCLIKLAVTTKEINVCEVVVTVKQSTKLKVYGSHMKKSDKKH